MKRRHHRYSSRKFIVCMTGMASGFVLALLGRLTTEYATIITAATVAYSAANAYTTGSGTAAPDCTGITPEEN